MLPFAAALTLAANPVVPDNVDEARITLDVKDAEVHDIVRALAEVAGFQAVFDPDLTCRLTLNVRETRWGQVLDSVLNACALGYEEEGTVMRIARRSQIAMEAADRRRLAEIKQQTRSRRVERFRLSYARAREMAPIVKRFLSARGEVVHDERTNTLIIID
jgi:type IV pilus assembly protein PilQ